MKTILRTLFLIVGILNWNDAFSQTFYFPTVTNTSTCDYAYDLTVTIRLDSVKVTNIYFDDGTNGSFAFEAYASYENVFENSTLPPGNFYTYDITLFSDNPNLSPGTISNNIGSVPVESGTGGGFASQNNPTYNGSASALGLTSGQFYKSPQLLSELGYDSAAVHVNLPCLDTSVSADSVTDPLPVNWSGIAAQVEGKNVTLSWTTYMEAQNSGFDVQTSWDAKKWNTIGNVPSKAMNGYTDMSLNYSFSTIAKTPGTRYYRLIQHDFDGGRMISNIVAVNVKSSSLHEDLAVFPNPVQSELQIKNAEPNMPYTVFDLNGKLMLSGNYTNSIDISRLKPGLYLVRSNSNIATRFLVTPTR